MIAHKIPGVQVSCKEMLLDGVTPIAAYAALRGLSPGPTFLLESAPGAGELARHSIIGIGALGELVAASGEVRLSTPAGKSALAAASILDAARRLVLECTPSRGLASFADPSQAALLGAYGIASFELAGYFERLGHERGAPDCDPDLHLVVPEHVVVFDHYTHTAAIVSLQASNGANLQSVSQEALVEQLSSARIGQLLRPGGAGQLRLRAAPSSFTAMVHAAKSAIREGEVFQVVLSQTWQTALEADPFDVYRRLRSINPSPYMFYLELDGRVLLGSSPEMLCKLAARRARLRPLAGTRARPPLPEQEPAVARQLRRDPKERAEHIMLVDLGRNDLGRVCDYGSIKLSELLAIERYSHVMHLVSEVRGTIRSDCDAFDLFAATFPAGTVSGAPKIRAMQLIAQLEGKRRGAYGGSVVRFGFDGSLDACIVLRSAEVRDGVATVSAGAGIVADSIAEREDAECRAKARAVERALGCMESGS
ncbi:MAG: anthranilate synthase component I family protein [Candidatus Eremiobacteraeota bacterium]|nr:anthranilate synthase component I family protein [Candidatus Eremiobacteraeota bacterium]